MIQKDFAEYAASLHEAALPPEIVHGAKRVVIDWFAATVPGAAVAPATLLIKALQKEGIGQGSAVLVPSGKRASLRTAALINGTAAHTVEFDDIYRFAIYHPGVVVIPAALAAAQTEHASGDRFLRAVIAGYEVSNRIGRTVNPAHYKYWHTTGTVGHFGAAVATAVVLGLDAGQIAHALATAGTMAAALQQAFRADAMTKPMHAGQAASNGALAAMAAGAGVTGAPSMFEGEVGFGAAMSDNPDWSAALADLGSHWTILDMTQKNHACCGFIHAAIDALMNLRLEHGLEADNVARIRVGTYGTALEVAGNENPKTLYECKFSIPYCAALALLTGRVRMDAFADEWLHDTRVREVMGRVEMYVDAEADAAFPGQRGALVEIETTSGERYSERRRTRKGDSDDPLTEAELADKYWELVTPVIGAEAGGLLLDGLNAIETLDDMSALPFQGPLAESRSRTG